MNWYKLIKISSFVTKKLSHAKNNLFNLDIGIHEFKLGHATIFYQIYESGEIGLSSLRVPMKYRGAGYAKKILKSFTNWLDENKLVSKLSASPLDYKTNRNKLEELYKSFGYVPTGYFINPLKDKEMIRYPE